MALVRNYKGFDGGLGYLPHTAVQVHHALSLIASCAAAQTVVQQHHDQLKHFEKRQNRHSYPQSKMAAKRSYQVFKLK